MGQQTNSEGQYIHIEPWAISEVALDATQAALNETLFALGNGQIGVRGAHDEGDVWAGTAQNDVFINGFYESEPIVYPESAYGFAKENQFIVRVPNATGFTFSMDGEAFDPNLGVISEFGFSDGRVETLVSLDCAVGQASPREQRAFGELHTHDGGGGALCGDASEFFGRCRHHFDGEQSTACGQGRRRSARRRVARWFVKFRGIHG